MDPTPTTRPRSCLNCRWVSHGAVGEPATCEWLRHLLDGYAPPTWLKTRHVMVGDGAMGVRCRAWLRVRSGEGPA
jgi:hypothetical protein